MLTDIQCDERYAALMGLQKPPIVPWLRFHTLTDLSDEEVFSASLDGDFTLRELEFVVHVMRERGEGAQHG